jgi:hypothetical protein
VDVVGVVQSDPGLLDDRVIVISSPTLNTNGELISVVNPETYVGSDGGLVAIAIEDIVSGSLLADAAELYKNVIVGAVLYPALPDVNVIPVTEPDELMVAVAVAVFGAPSTTT